MLLIKTRLIPVSGRSIFTLGMLFFVFFVSELLASESGLMAVAVFGLALSTIDYRDKEKLLSFKEQISKIVISLLFILLSAHFNITLLAEQVLPGLAVVGIKSYRVNFNLKHLPREKTRCPEAPCPLPTP
ncbi:MAG: hypothetical protein JXA07_01880 [Spirochaetes bacterium]|nr:hypothetical protein [Spirochaetota bacterium]